MLLSLRILAWSRSRPRRKTRLRRLNSATRSVSCPLRLPSSRQLPQTSVLAEVSSMTYLIFGPVRTLGKQACSILAKKRLSGYRDSFEQNPNSAVLPLPANTGRRNHKCTTIDPNHRRALFSVSPFLRFPASVLSPDSPNSPFPQRATKRYSLLHPSNHFSHSCPLRRFVAPSLRRFPASPFACIL